MTDRLFLTILTPKKIVSLHKMHSAVENVKQSIGRQLNCGKLDLIKEAFHIKQVSHFLCVSSSLSVLIMIYLAFILYYRNVMLGSNFISFYIKNLQLMYRVYK